MPTYCYECECGNEFERILSIHDETVQICSCGFIAKKVIKCAPQILADIKPYKSVVTGKMITSRSAHRNYLKDNNLTEVGNEKPPWMDDYVRRRDEGTLEKKSAQAKDEYDFNINEVLK